MRRPHRRNLLIAAGLLFAAIGGVMTASYYAADLADDPFACLPADAEVVLRIDPALCRASPLARRLLELPPLRGCGESLDAFAGKLREGGEVAIGLDNGDWIVLAPLSRAANWVLQFSESGLIGDLPEGVELAVEAGIVVAASDPDLVTGACQRIAARSRASAAPREPTHGFRLTVRSDCARELLWVALGARQLDGDPHLDRRLEEIGDVRLHGCLRTGVLTLDGVPREIASRWGERLRKMVDRETRVVDGVLDLAALRTRLLARVEEDARAEVDALRPHWEQGLRMRLGRETSGGVTVALPDGNLEDRLERRARTELPIVRARRRAAIDAWLAGFRSLAVREEGAEGQLRLHLEIDQR